ncbi:hypothetical protein Tco_0545115 [Tanacetum coccineum]
MASQEARLSKFKADFKQQQSEMTNKIDTVLKAITNRLAGSLPSNTVKNLKLNTPLVLSARSYPTIDPQYSSHPSTSINAIKAHSKEANIFLDTSSTMIRGIYAWRALELVKNDIKNRPGEVGIQCKRSQFRVMEKHHIGPRLEKGNHTKPRPSSDGIGAQIPYYARKDFLDCHLPGEWEIARDAEINPFKDVLVFRRMVEFLGAIPINLKNDYVWHCHLYGAFDSNSKLRPSPTPKRTINDVEQTYPPTTVEEKLARKNELKARDSKEAIRRKRFRRSQKIIVQLRDLGETIFSRDMNLKIYKKSPSEWKTHTLIWRNKPDLDTLRMDDLYNNLKIYETEVKGSSTSNQNHKKWLL